MVSINSKRILTCGYRVDICEPPPEGVRIETSKATATTTEIYIGNSSENSNCLVSTTLSSSVFCPTDGVHLKERTNWAISLYDCDKR